MPQHELPLGGPPPINRLSIELEDLTFQLHDAIGLTLRTGRLDQPLTAIGRLQFSGCGSDLLTSVAGDLVSAWQFGTQRDVLIALEQGRKAARRHEQTYAKP